MPDSPRRPRSSLGGHSLNENLNDNLNSAPSPEPRRSLRSPYARASAGPLSFIDLRKCGDDENSTLSAGQARVCGAGARGGAGGAGALQRAGGARGVTPSRALRVARGAGGLYHATGERPTETGRRGCVTIWAQRSILRHPQDRCDRETLRVTLGDARGDSARVVGFRLLLF